MVELACHSSLPFLPRHACFFSTTLVQFWADQWGYPSRVPTNLSPGSVRSLRRYGGTVGSKVAWPPMQFSPLLSLLDFWLVPRCRQDFLRTSQDVTPSCESGCFYRLLGHFHTRTQSRFPRSKGLILCLPTLPLDGSFTLCVTLLFHVSAEQQGFIITHLFARNGKVSETGIAGYDVDVLLMLID